MKKYSKILVFYHTGTGNALKVSNWINEFGLNNNTPVKIYSIDKHFKPDYNEINLDTLLFFIYPTHGFNASPAMIDFALKFKKIKNDFVLINTRAGGKFFKYNTPGVSGIALLIIMFILFIKGLTFKSAKSVDLPSNWISIHPGFSTKWIDEISENCYFKFTTYLDNLIFKDIKNYRFLFELPIDLALMPIAILYYFIGRFFLAKTFIYSSKCNGCKICSELCPVNAITMIKNRPYWTYKCESCMRCENICPTIAVQSSHLIFLFAILISSISFYKYLIPNDLFNFGFLEFIFDSFISLLLIFSVYKLLFYLFRNKYILKIFEYTSLTRYWRRYLAKDIKSKDFKK